MTRKALWLLAASLAVLVATQWKDIARYLKIVQMSSGPGPGAPQPAAAPPPAAPPPAAPPPAPEPSATRNETGDSLN
jgi:hypothetical protein